MTPEQVLAQPARILSQKQRESYFAKGYLLVENAVPSEWIVRLRAAAFHHLGRDRAQQIGCRLRPGARAQRREAPAAAPVEPGRAPRDL